MKKEKIAEMAWAILIAQAFTEAICGKKFMKRIRKRLNVLDRDAEAEVWIGVMNQFHPDKRLSTGNTAFAHSQVVREEINLIVEKLNSCVLPDDDILEERMKRIIERKMNLIQQMNKLL